MHEDIKNAKIYKYLLILEGSPPLAGIVRIQSIKTTIEKRNIVFLTNFLLFVEIQYNNDNKNDIDMNIRLIQIISNFSYNASIFL